MAVSPAAPAVTLDVGEHPNGIYSDKSLFARIFRGEVGERYLPEAGKYGEDVIACTRDICDHIYDTHDGFPAHVEAVHVPGIWLHAHHVEERYYEQYFRNRLTDAHRNHDHAWHGPR
jgi:hypothetical protein